MIKEMGQEGEWKRDASVSAGNTGKTRSEREHNQKRLSRRPDAGQNLPEKTDPDRENRMRLAALRRRKAVRPAPIPEEAAKQSDQSLPLPEEPAKQEDKSMSLPEKSAEKEDITVSHSEKYAEQADSPVILSEESAEQSVRAESHESETKALTGNTHRSRKERRRSARSPHLDEQKTGRRVRGHAATPQNRQVYAERQEEYSDEEEDAEDEYWEEDDEEEPSRKKKSSGIILWILLLVFACIFFFSLFELISIYQEYNQGTEEYENVRDQAQAMLSDIETGPDETKVSSDQTGGGEDASETEAEALLANHDRNEKWFDQLESVYPEIVGWITIPDTVIDYPVMYSGDNTYYLTHTCVGTVNSSGSIFLEAQNREDLSDIHIIIYGHNMKNGSMFAGLKNYRDYSYWQQHPEILLETREGTTVYQIFSVEETTADSDIYSVDYEQGDSFQTFVQKLKSNSLYDTGVEVTGEDQVISLSTCTNNADGRLVVHARKKGI